MTFVMQRPSVFISICNSIYSSTSEVQHYEMDKAFVIENVIKLRGLAAEVIAAVHLIGELCQLCGCVDGKRRGIIVVHAPQCVAVGFFAPTATLCLRPPTDNSSRANMKRIIFFICFVDEYY